MRRNKMFNGGDFQSGVYNGGGSVKRTRRTKEQIRKDEYNKEIDLYKWYVINVSEKKAEAGYQYKEDALDFLSDYDGDKNFKVVSKISLKKYGIEIPNESWKYAMGGSLEAHGIKEGDTFLKTISGGIQKVKDRNGNIVYVNLSNGERSSKPILPFDDGGKLGEEEVTYFINKDGIKVRSQAMPKEKLSEREWMSKHNQSKEARTYENGGDLFEDYKRQPKELAEIVDFYMEKFNDGDYDYVDSRNFLKEVNAIGYTFDYGLDNVPYNLRPINQKYALGGLFGKAKQTLRPEKYPNLEGKQVSLKNGKMVQVFDQNGSQLSVLELGRIGTGERPHLIDISEVDMTSFKNGGKLIGNQKRIDMNKNGKIDAEDFKLLRSSMNGAWRNERKHVNHNEDYEVRYAKPRPKRTGYKGKRRFDEGGEVSFIEYNGTEIMFEPSSKKYYAKDVEFNTLEEAIRFIKNEEVDSRIRDAYSRGLFNNGGGISDFEVGDSVTIIKPFPNADMTGKRGKIVELTKNNTGVIYISVDGRRIAVLKDYIKKNKTFATGGGISNFERLSRIVAKNHEGKSVKPKYQKQYGKTYSKAEAKEVGNKVAGKMKAMKKAESGASVKKGNRGGVMVLAKKIRKEGESWKDALKRAGQQLK
jgi:hypothetical protein